MGGVDYFIVGMFGCLSIWIGGWSDEYIISNKVGDATARRGTPAKIGEILECSVSDPTRKWRSFRYGLEKR